MKRAALVSLLISISFFTLSQDVKYLQDEDTIPFDPAVRYGRLANGFTFYIRKNNNSGNKIILYFVVKAGILHEDSSQAGLAHLLEHMAFRGTIHFPNDGYLEKYGISMGENMSATTQYGATIFKLTIPAKDPELLEKSLLVISDWTNGLLLDEEKLESERGVVLSEILRGGDEHLLKISDQYLSQVFGNSSYGNSRKDATTRMIENTSRITKKQLSEFYRNWYHPNLEAIIVVGELDEDKMENKVRNIFSSLKNQTDPKNITFINTPLNGENKFILVTDQKVSTVSIRVYMKRPGTATFTRNALKKLIYADLFNEMIWRRFSEIRRKRTKSLKFGSISSQRLTDVAGTELDAISIIIPDVNINDMKHRFQTVFIELEKIFRFGFNESEFEKAKEVLLNLNGGAITDSKSIVQNYLQHFLKLHSGPALTYRSELYKTIINEVQLNEVNENINEWISGKNRDIVIVAPEESRDLLPDENAIQLWLEEVKNLATNPDNVVPVFSSRPLIPIEISSRLSNSSFLLTHKIKSVDVTCITLGNGIKVILKPFKPEGYQSNKILLRGLKSGRYSHVSSYEASIATKVIANSGSISFSNSELDQYLSAKSVSLTPYFNNNEIGFTGSSPLLQSETMLQLVYLYLMSPNIDQNVFDRVIAAHKETIVNRRASTLDQALLDSMKVILADKMDQLESHVLQNILDTISTKHLFNIYRESFGDADDFTFVITGNFSLDEMIPLVTKYLGSIPASSQKRRSNLSSPSRLPVASPIFIRKTFYSKTNAQAIVRTKITGRYKSNEKQKVEVLQSLLQERLINRLRRKEGGTYWPFSALTFSQSDEARFSVDILFDCAGNKADQLSAAVVEEIEMLRTLGVGSEIFKRVISKHIAEKGRNLKSNSFWIGHLVENSKSVYTIQSVINDVALANELSIKEIKNAARRLFKKANIMQFILKPAGN